VKPSRDPQFNSVVSLASVFPRGQSLLELSIYQGHGEINNLELGHSAFAMSRENT